MADWLGSQFAGSQRPLRARNEVKEILVCLSLAFFFSSNSRLLLLSQACQPASRELDVVGLDVTVVAVGGGCCGCSASAG